MMPRLIKLETMTVAGFASTNISTPPFWRCQAKTLPSIFAILNLFKNGTLSGWGERISTVTQNSIVFYSDLD